MHHLERARGLTPGARSARSVSLVAMIALGMVALVAMGPALPLGASMTRAEHWSSWLTTVGTATALMAAIRAVGLVVGAYLLVVSTLDLAATLTRSPVLTSVSRRVTLPFARRLIAGVTGAGLAVSLSIGGVVAPTLASAAPRPQATATTPPPTLAGPGPNRTMRHADPAYASGTPTTRPAPNPTMRRPDPAYPSRLDASGPSATEADTSSDAVIPPTMRRLDIDPAHEPAAPETTTVAPAPSPTMSGETTTPPSSVAAGSTDSTASAASWTIAPGDHLWRVATRTLQTAWGRPPRDEETARYLATLVRANQDVLAVADNADLVFPGQVFALPAVPAA